MTRSEIVGWISKLFYEIQYTELQGENIIWIPGKCWHPTQHCFRNSCYWQGHSKNNSQYYPSQSPD